MNAPTVSPSIFNRWFDALYQCPRSLLLFLAILLLMLPFGFAVLQGQLAALFHSGNWRAILVSPLIVIYIVALVPVMSRTDEAVVGRLRPIVQLSDDDYAVLVRRETSIRPWVEIGALMTGMLLGAISLTPWLWGPDDLLLGLYALVTTMAMYGLLAWVIVGAVATTRLTNALLRAPLTVDIFDVTPFEPIGRQSLMLSFSFIVGITISLLFVTSRENLYSVGSIVVYGTLLAVSVLVFFLNMRPTHRVLAQAKTAELRDAEMNIRMLYRRLQRSPQDDGGRTETAQELNAWLAMERRLRTARTWPYNTEMLRTLAVSVLTPIAVGLSRMIPLLLENSR